MTKIKLARLSIALVVGFLPAAGCKKSGGDGAGPPMQVEGVQIDLPKFQQAFVNNPEFKDGAVANVTDAVRYGRYPAAIAELEKLAANTALNDAQKKAVNDLLTQIKQVSSKAGTPAP